MPLSVTPSVKRSFSVLEICNVMTYPSATSQEISAMRSAMPVPLGLVSITGKDVLPALLSGLLPISNDRFMVLLFYA